MAQWFGHCLSGCFLVLSLLVQNVEASGVLPEVIVFSGNGNAKVIRNGIEKDASVGMKVDFGSYIKTGANNSLTLSYPDGSLLAVDADSNIQVLERTGGTQRNSLDYGQVRGSVSKVPAGAKVESKKPRFVVRSRSAVLGVRGTEFVMAVDQGSQMAQIHTLEGAVDVAADEGGLLSGKAVTAVKSGEFIEATQTGLGSTRPFVRDEFLNTIKPQPSGVVQGMAISDAKGHTILKMATTPPPTQTPEGLQLKPVVEEPKRDPDKPTPQPTQQQGTPAADAKKLDELDRPMRLKSFMAGIFFMKDIRPPILRAAHIAWAPMLPIPGLKIFWLRGHLGAVFAQDGSLYNRLWVTEYQLYGVVTWNDRIYGEMGIGEQRWSRENIQGGLVTLNAGLILQAGVLDRIIFGRSWLLRGDTKTSEFRLSVGLVY